MTIRTILVDDEPLAIQGLNFAWQAHEDVEIIETCRTAARRSARSRPTSPISSSSTSRCRASTASRSSQGLMEVEPPLFVFVTAYSDHALRASRPARSII
jgi:two-component system LytT family response regulator